KLAFVVLGYNPSGYCLISAGISDNDILRRKETKCLQRGLLSATSPPTYTKCVKSSSLDIISFAFLFIENAVSLAICTAYLFKLGAGLPTFNRPLESSPLFHFSIRDNACLVVIPETACLANRFFTGCIYESAIAPELNTSLA